MTMMRRNYEIEMTRKIGNEGMLMMVTLEAREMTKTGDASSWKGFKLSRCRENTTRIRELEARPRGLRPEDIKFVCFCIKN